MVRSAVDSVERLDDGDGFNVGTRWRETRTMFGRQAAEEMEVTAVDVSRSYRVVAAGASTTYGSTLTVEALGLERITQRRVGRPDPHVRPRRR